MLEQFLRIFATNKVLFRSHTVFMLFLLCLAIREERKREAPDLPLLWVPAAVSLPV